MGIIWVPHQPSGSNAEALQSVWASGTSYQSACSCTGQQHRVVVLNSILSHLEGLGKPGELPRLEQELRVFNKFPDEAESHFVKHHLRYSPSNALKNPKFQRPSVLHTLGTEALLIYSIPQLFICSSFNILGQKGTDTKSIFWTAIEVHSENHFIAY